jgi:hypothetical protein
MAEKVSKLDAALDAALGEGNFKRLEDTLKKLG